MRVKRGSAWIIFAPALELRPHEPLEADRMRLGGIGAVDQDQVGVPDVTPVVRHRPSAERGGQTGHRGAVSNAGLLLDVDDAERAHQLGGEVALLGAERRPAGEGDALAAVDDVAVVVLRDERACRATSLIRRASLSSAESQEISLPLGARRARGRAGLGGAGARRRAASRSRPSGRASLVDRAVGIALDLQQLDLAVLVLRV